MDADLRAALKLAIDNGDDIAAAALAALTEAESQTVALMEAVQDVADTLEVAHLGRTAVDASDLSARLDFALSNLSAAGTQHDEAILAGPKGALTRVMAEHTELVERVAVVVGIMRQIKRNDIADFLESAIPSNFTVEHDERVRKEAVEAFEATLGDPCASCHCPRGYHVSESHPAYLVDGSECYCEKWLALKETE